MATFRFSQAELVSIGRTKLAFLNADWDDFILFDPQRFTIQFRTEFEAVLIEARDTTGDETVVDVQAQKTIEVNNVMEAARRAYKVAKYFIQKTYEDNVAVQHEFGTDNYDEARRSVAKMVLFLSNLHKTMTARSADLIAMGYTAAQIAELASLRDKLEIVSYEQEIYMSGTRKQMTQLRTERFDALYRYIIQTCEAGKLIYENEDEARYQQYLLPQTGSNAEPPKSLAAGARILAVNDVQPEEHYKIENAGSESFVVWAAANADGDAPSTAIRIVADTNQILSVSALGASPEPGTPQYLVFWNDTTVVAKYHVKKME